MYFNNNALSSLFSNTHFFIFLSFVVFLIRIPIIWLTISFMPFMFLGFVMGDKMGQFDTMKMIVEGEYPRPRSINPSLPPRLEEIILRSLAKA